LVGNWLIEVPMGPMPRPRSEDPVSTSFTAKRDGSSLWVDH
jgi:hypothetical protein